MMRWPVGTFPTFSGLPTTSTLLHRLRRFTACRASPTGAASSLWKKVEAEGLIVMCFIIVFRFKMNKCPKFTSASPHSPTPKRYHTEKMPPKFRFFNFYYFFTFDYCTYLNFLLILLRFSKFE